MTTKTAKKQPKKRKKNMPFVFLKSGGIAANAPRAFLKNFEISGPLYLCLKVPVVPKISDKNVAFYR